MENYDSYKRSPPTRQRDGRRDEPYYDRRRSPDGRDRRDRRDRRRSRSPAQIDRYAPGARDEYGYRDRDRDRDERRDRKRSSPPPIDRYVPGQDNPPPAILINPLPDPLKLDFQVGFTWFAEWWRTEQRIKEEKEAAKSGRRPPRVRGERETREDRDAERPKIQAAYDQYKENLQRHQAQTFVRVHKNEDWFRERYVSEVRAPFRKNLMAFRDGLFERWQQDISNGVFDDFTLEGIYKSESNGMGGVLEREEGEAAAAAEVLGVGDLLPSKGGDIRDTVAQLPTLLIKTIAPTVTREKFEAFAKEHLGEEDGGFKHLSLSDPNPLKKCHRMGWIMLNPEQEAEEPTENRLERRGSIAEEGEDADGDIMENDKKSTLLSTSERALDRINGKTIEDPERGNFTVHCGVHRPPEAPRKKALWDLFSAPERIERDLELASRLVSKLDAERTGEEVSTAFAEIEARVNHLAANGALQPVQPSKPEKDHDTMQEEGEEGEEEEGQLEDEDESDNEDMIIMKKKLDLLVEYLRRVYNFCFFCVFESDSVHELQRKCPGGHLRRPRASLTSAAKETARASAKGEDFPLKKKSADTNGKDAPGVAEDGEMIVDAESPVEEKKSAFTKPGSKSAQQLQRAFNWVRTFEEKILQLLEPQNVNVKKLGGVPIEEGLEDELNKFVKQEDTSKYRCKVPDCTKLFKGVDFWRKHVEKRHPEFYERIHSDIELVNIYVLDPAHIAPSRSDANSNGHFPITHAGIPTGTPRGFQLNQAMPMGFPVAAGMAGTNGLPAAGVFNPIGGTLAPGLAATMAMTGAGIGPMRNRGNFSGGYGRSNNGPYARPDGRGRIPSMSGGKSGFMGLPGIVPGVGMRGVNIPGMAMTEGGALAMGPEEAVRGRSLRSYEDLDADKGGGTGELNY
ncbi:hypothetical protein K431DRAFT_343419 [Polychaeton citri CBS 116435]|uniref:C2H2-type domain-containing protein n=1 Tax=Polychaeton citri CBS 116435 TaxID=1314669 RepID=A0A9P4QFM4_9PEZI|nr:hypothetical protein K431DRAFT_343419 [Polychaeton citri CBS 116435]